MKLSELQIGCKAIVQKISGGHEMKEKFLSLGVLEGDEIELLGRALFGGPSAFRLGIGQVFALRREHDEFIEVEIKN